MANKIAVLGSGVVGEILSNGFLKHGHEVMRGSREPHKLGAWKERAGGKASAGDFAQAAAFGDTVVLAVKGSAAEAVVASIADRLADKTVIDATNPIADLPPDHGVLRFFTNLDESLMERLQAKAPAARFVKAFSQVANAWMVNPDFGGVRPTMFICGNHGGAKQEVTRVLDAFGWDAEDMGTAASARAIEPLCMLYCIPGLTKNSWTHAFKLLKK